MGIKHTLTPQELGLQGLFCPVPASSAPATGSGWPHFQRGGIRAENLFHGLRDSALLLWSAGGRLPQQWSFGVSPGLRHPRIEGCDNPPIGWPRAPISSGRGCSEQDRRRLSQRSLAGAGLRSDCWLAGWLAGGGWRVCLGELGLGAGRQTELQTSRGWASLGGGKGRRRLE